MNLGSIREYAQKTTEIISTVADMQVLVCDMQFQIIGDSKDGITNQRALNKLTGNSMLVETVRLRKMMVIEDSKKDFAGCKNCPEKNACDVNAMISIPIIDGEDIYGAIGLYAHGKEDVKRLMEKNKDFLEFIHRMSELLVMKLKETSETKKLKETVKQLKNNSCNLHFEDIVGSSPAFRNVKE